MPTLYNQTNRPLSWVRSGRKFVCEPWGAVDVPLDMVETTRAIGVPVGSAPVPAETRANRKVADERAAADTDAFRKLERRAHEAERKAQASEAAFDAMQAQNTTLERTVRELEQALANTVAELEQAKADKAAAEALLTETAQQATEAETRALKAEERARKPKKAG